MIEFQPPIPVFRIFDVAKAKEFYIDYLGFEIEWEHRFEESLPLYMQIRRSGFVLHLSEHYGDGSPGAVVYARMTGLREYHAKLKAKNYNYLRPGINEDAPGEARELAVIDPFGNRIRFAERK